MFKPLTTVAGTFYTLLEQWEDVPFVPVCVCSYICIICIDYVCAYVCVYVCVCVNSDACVCVYVYDNSRKHGCVRMWV